MSQAQLDRIEAKLDKIIAHQSKSIEPMQRTLVSEPCKPIVQMPPEMIQWFQDVSSILSKGVVYPKIN